MSYFLVLVVVGLVTANKQSTKPSDNPDGCYWTGCTWVSSTPCERYYDQTNFEYCTFGSFPTNSYYCCPSYSAKCAKPQITGWDFYDCPLWYNKEKNSCHVRCATGYTGTVSAYCSPSGQSWQWVTSGTCSLVNCHQPSRPNTNYNPCSYLYGGTCSASCATGYIGYPTAVCTVSGTWSYGGTCNAVECPSPAWPHTTFPSCSTSYAGSCTAQCEVGYTGSPTAVCRARSGATSGYWQYGGECNPVQCAWLSRSHATFPTCSHDYQSSCTARCSTGYTGSVTAVCTATAGATIGTWSYTGTCDPIPCPRPSSDHAIFSPCRYEYGSTCTATCEAGYTANGATSFTAYCNAYGSATVGTWQYSATCLPVDCVYWPAVANAYFSPCNTYYGGSCTGHCNYGYIGSPTAVCQARAGDYQGYWVTGGSCNPVNCGWPSISDAIPNANVGPCVTYYGGSCTVRCNFGYTGSPTATCQPIPDTPAGQWSFGGSCVPVPCAWPSVPNAHIESCDLFYGGSCTVRCDAGFTGFPTAVCTAAAGATAGTWALTGSCNPVPSNSPSPAASSMPSPSPSAAESASPSPADSASPIPADSASPIPADSASPIPADSASPIPADSASPIPADSASPIPADSASPIPADSASPIPIESSSPNPSQSIVAQMSSASPEPSPSEQPDDQSQSSSHIPQPIVTPKSSISLKPSPRSSASLKPSRSPSATPKPSRSPSASPKRSRSPSTSPKRSRSPSATPRPSRSPSASPKPSRSPSVTPKPSRLPSASPRPSHSPVHMAEEKFHVLSIVSGASATHATPSIQSRGVAAPLLCLLALTLFIVVSIWYHWRTFGGNQVEDTLC